MFNFNSIENDHKIYTICDNFYAYVGIYSDTVVWLEFTYDINDNIIENAKVLYNSLKYFWNNPDEQLKNGRQIYYHLTITLKGNVILRDQFIFVNLLSAKTHNKALSILLLTRLFTCLYKELNITSNTIEKIVGFIRLNTQSDNLLACIKQKDIENVFSEL